MKKTLITAILGLVLSAGLRAETVLDRPEIIIGFDDDASSLLITAGWKDKNGGDLRETFNLGKDLHVVFVKKGNEWIKSDNEFTSKNWEAFLLPDASGFILMEREYDGHSFENVSLRIYEYFPVRRLRSLRLANGSPYWSQDGKQLALVEVLDGKFNVVIYDIIRGSVVFKKAGLSEQAGKELLGDYKRARICDDEMPCESAPTMTKKDKAKLKGKK